MQRVYEENEWGKVSKRIITISDVVCFDVEEIDSGIQDNFHLESKRVFLSFESVADWVGSGGKNLAGISWICCTLDKVLMA